MSNQDTTTRDMYVAVAATSQHLGARGYNGTELEIYMFMAKNDVEKVKRLAGIAGMLEKKYSVNKVGKRNIHMDEFLSPFDPCAVDAPSGHAKLSDLSFVEVQSFLSFNNPEELEMEYFAEVYKAEIEETTAPDYDEWMDSHENDLRMDVHAVVFVDDDCDSINVVEVREEKVGYRFEFKTMERLGEWIGEEDEEELMYQITNGVSDWIQKVRELDVGLQCVDNDSEFGVEWDDIVVKKKKKKEAGVQCEHVFTRGKKKGERCTTVGKVGNVRCAAHKKKE